MIRTYDRRSCLDPERRAWLAACLREAQEARGLSAEQIARKAQIAIQREAEARRLTDRERAEWRGVVITRSMVRAILAGPAAPLGTLAGRARLWAVATALEVDLAIVNRLAGGV